MLADNLHNVKETIASALARRAERKETGDEVCLVAVTKNHPAAVVTEIQALGVGNIGENRVQEAREKQQQVGHPGKWHLIGHLQTNKVKQVVGKVDLIQSVDRRNLLEAINKEAARQNIVQDILLEINIGNEESKSGFAIEDIHPLLEKIGDFSAIRIRGLMAIPPICQNSTDNHKFFQEMCKISVDIKAKKYDNVSVEIMSMGMSDDFADAIACGSTMIRVGTAIFGPRNYQ